MSERMPIPDAKGQAADIVIDAIRRHGIDPWKAAYVPIFRDAARLWTRGELTDHQFGRLCENMAILFPNLKAT